MKAAVLTSFLLLVPMAGVQAQGLVGGAQQGAAEGARAAGPVGGVMGGVVGGVAGAVGGLLGVDQRPRFHEYVVRSGVPSYTYRGRVAVGTALPRRGVTYYEMPAEYGVRGYRYTVVNQRTVLVDPRTHRIVQVIV